MSLKNSLKYIRKKSFSVNIFGLGYVGFPLAVKLASEGIKILGIDVNKERLERLKKNNLMDSEIHLEKEFINSVSKNNLSFSLEPTNSENCQIAIICVPTPIPSKDITSDIFVKSAVEKFLTVAKKGDIIILESSIEVGTTENIQKLIENSYNVGNDFGLAFCPERIDPANKEWSIENIPRVIYCSDDNTFEICKIIYQNVNDGNLIRVELPKIAEVVKSFENAFRLVNISLVNQLAMLCDKLGIDVKRVIDVAATKPFGFMPHYPGAGAGGHCIPKDPRFLLNAAKKAGVSFSTIENALEINLLIPNYIATSISNSLNSKKLDKKVLIWGLTYKANVEDMRDSPSFKLATELMKKNIRVFGYDPFFNNEFVEKYLIENNLKKINFEVVDTVTEDLLQSISCICVVQHHEEVEKKLIETYDNSKVPFIFDCQSKLIKNPNSSTILDYLGSK